MGNSRSVLRVRHKQNQGMTYAEIWPEKDWALLPIDENESNLILDLVFALSKKKSCLCEFWISDHAGNYSESKEFTKLAVEVPTGIETEPTYISDFSIDSQDSKGFMRIWNTCSGMNVYPTNNVIESIKNLTASKNKDIFDISAFTESLNADSNDKDFGERLEISFLENPSFIQKMTEGISADALQQMFGLSQTLIPARERGAFFNKGGYDDNCCLCLLTTNEDAINILKSGFEKRRIGVVFEDAPNKLG